MYGLVKRFDAILNRFTMYLIMVGGLIVQLIIADILAFTGHVGVGPIGLLVSTAILAAACYLANFLFSLIFKVPRNRESWLITALILAFVMPPTSDVKGGLLLALTALIAMASKYLIIYRGSNIVNPAVAGAVVMTLTGLLPAIWWVATPALLPVTVLFALVVLRKQRKFSMFAAFALVAIAMLLFIGLVFQDHAVGAIIKTALTSFPLIFMGSIMLTEPSTMPQTRYYQVLEGLLIGCLFASQLRSGRLASTPENALLVGNIFAFIVAPAMGHLVVLKDKIRLAPDIYELVFSKPAHGKFAFAAGQYVEWTLPRTIADSRGNRRSFSIASAPTEADLRIGIRVAGDKGSTFKKQLLDMKPGQRIRAAHVAGDFTLPADHTQPLLLIAGGIGVTPIRSMLQSIVDGDAKRDVEVLYLANDEQSFVYKDVFKKAQALGVKIHLKVGRVSSEELKGLIPDVKKRQIYISGPPPMVDGYRRGLRRLGVAATRIRTDHFSGY